MEEAKPRPRARGDQPSRLSAYAMTGQPGPEPAGINRGTGGNRLSQRAYPAPAGIISHGTRFRETGGVPRPAQPGTGSPKTADPRPRPRGSTALGEKKMEASKPASRARGDQPHFYTGRPDGRHPLPRGSP